MSRFRAGRFDREKLGVLKKLAPLQSVHSLVDVTPEELLLAKKKLLLVDVDNTLVGWRSEEIPETTLAWLGFMKSAGLKICIISNTKRLARLERLAAAMDVPFLRGRFKPSRRMYRQALANFGFQAEDAVMIGDQLFTDIFGANRTGIDAIWVKQMTPRDFIGTKISRLGERLLGWWLHRAIKESNDGASGEVEDLPIGGSAAFVLLRSPAVRQFIKFCVVGGTSTVIDLGLFWVMRFSGGEHFSSQLGSWLVAHASFLFGGYVHNPAEASVPVLRTISASISLLNSFFWNRRWTFSIQGKEHRSVQFQKFLIVSVIGIVLSVALTTLFVSVFSGPVKARTSVALAIATVLVAIWNFTGQKYWTFKHKH